MKHDLLIKEFDKHVDLFLDGMINYDLFTELETLYLKRKKLFTICLN